MTTVKKKSQSFVPPEIAQFQASEKLWNAMRELENEIGKLQRPKARLHGLLNLDTLRGEIMYFEYGIDKPKWQ